MLRSKLWGGVIQSTKGFLVEAEDAHAVLRCRDLRGFSAVAAACRDTSMTTPERLVIVLPDLAMEDWLASWAEDVGQARRSIVATRASDGSDARLVGTLLAYGYGVETVIRVERVEPKETASRSRLKDTKTRRSA